VALAGVGLGSLALASGSAELIQRIGWRATLWYFGIASMAVLIPINVVFHRHSAEAVGLHPDGRAPDGRAAAHPPDSHMTVRAALVDRNFWWLFAAVTAIGLVTMTMIVHQTRLLMDVGFSLSLASLLFGMLGVTRSVGGLFWGPLSDRIGRTACVVLICAASFLGLGLLLLLPYLPADAGGWRLALLAAYLAAFGLGYNGMSPVFASTVSDHFAGRNLGTIMGMLDLGFGVGSAFGPWWGGWIFDRLGGYGWVVAGVMAGVVITGVTLGAAGRKYKPAE
jgi:predicted MFS family arabinose efflux permease